MEMLSNEHMTSEKRVIVITGGSSGIGRAMAEAFARNDDQVVIIGRQEDDLETAAKVIGSNCSWQRADVSHLDQVAQAVHAIATRFKKIDVLINNAGYSGYERNANLNMPLDRAKEVWDEQIGVNLTGTFMMTFASAPYLSRPGGRIINISSDAALTGGIGLRLAGYVAAKAGLLGLTRSLALEFGPQGITVNVIAPGFIAGTGMNTRLTDEIVQTVAAQLPVKRAGQANDVAAAALFLASREAGFITGELLNVNGGRIFGG